MGYIWGWVNGHDRAWRTVRRAVLAFDIATITWVLVFAARFVVQHHLYDADQTGWLGVARIAMGWPLTAVAALATYLAIRSAQRRCTRTRHAAEPDGRIRRRRGRGAGNLVDRNRATTDRPLLAVAILASFVAFLDGSVVNLALPAIGREFGGGLALQQWVVDGYLLALGALILVAGAISDAFGRLVVLRTGLVVFAVSSLLCAFAPTRLGAGRRPLPAGRRCGLPGAQLAGDDQRPVLRGRAGQCDRHLDRLDRNGFRHRPAARRCAGRRAGLAVDLRGQHRCRWPSRCT